MTTTPADPAEALTPLTSPAELDGITQDEIRRLAVTVEDHDGAEPLNEPALLQLPVPAGSGLTHVLERVDGSVVGYAQIMVVDPSEVELVVADVGDRVGRTVALLAAAETAAGDKDLLVWSRGRSPVTAAAESRGYEAVRTLLTMRRPLPPANPEPVQAPPGVTLRTFVPGVDDTAWLAVNAAAFATHPEQGRWTNSDLAERMAQPWFEPDGFILAVEENSGELIGYHWTKVHEPVRPGRPPVGEVYVLGIAPAAQGRGLGRVLLEAGLRHLAAGPAREVILYVEQDNDSAVHLYERNGFAVDRRDVQFRRASSG